MALLATDSDDVYRYLRFWPANAPDNQVNIQSVSEIFGIIMNVLLGSALAISLIAVILSGIRFITSRGDPKAAASAKKALTYSVVAFLIALGAFTVKVIIFNVMGGDFDDLWNATPSF